MAISYDAEKRIFKLDTDHTSYLIGLTDTISPFPQRDEEEESS